MLAAALEAEVDAYLAELKDLRDEAGKRLVVRNGHAKPRQVLTMPAGRNTPQGDSSAQAVTRSSLCPVGHRMRKMIVKAAAVVATATAAAVCPAVPGTAAPAERCTTTNKEIDMPSYDGPWPDNWTFHITLCAQRSGSDVVHRARVSWEVPAGMYPGPVDPFHYSNTNLEVRGRRQGGPTAKTTWIDLVVPLNKVRDGSREVRFRVSYPRGSKAVTEADLNLDWRHHGNAPANYRTKPSPAA